MTTNFRRLIKLITLVISSHNLAGLFYLFRDEEKCSRLVGEKHSFVAASQREVSLSTRDENDFHFV